MFCAKVSSKTAEKFFPDTYVTCIYKNGPKCIYHKSYFFSTTVKIFAISDCC